MKHLLLSFLAAVVLFVPAVMAQETAEATPEATTVGAWNITYTLGPTTVTRQIKFVAYSDRTGKFIAGPRATMTTNAASNAVWDDPAQLFSFSGEVRIPLGNVGVETGTLVFKAINGNTGLLHGQVVYVQNSLVASPSTLYTIRTGTFTATPIVSPTP